MMTRREAICLLGSASVGARFNASAARKGDSTPPLARGAPMSPERMALIEAFKKRSDGLEKKFEARIHKKDLGDDNEKQLGLGNIFGTRVWVLPENQRRFPCYVIAPQTDRGWIRYDLSKQPAQELPGFGDGNRLALEIVDRICHEFHIDERRIYVTGQSMGGAGTWNVIAYRPTFFAAAVICCGSISAEDGTGAIDTPLWNFHGVSDKTVPVSVSRERIAARRRAGGQPLYTEYAGVDHNSWQWAYTEPELVKWVFAQHRPN